MTAPTPAASSGKATIPLIIAAVVGFVGLLSCGLCAGLFFVGNQYSKEVAKRVHCMNNLKQLGIAIHIYSDTNDSLPTEAGANPSFYVPLLPYMELQHVAAGMQQGNSAAASTPVREFLCPSRRGVGSTPGGKRDYGYAASSQSGASVLDHSGKPPLTLGAIGNVNGTSNTLLLAHVWMDPKNYEGGDPTDLGWVTKNNARSINNAAFQDTDANGSIKALGGPHKEGAIVLFADGTVRPVPYQFSHWAQAWSWQNTTPVPLP